jgi:hypothetical protein
LSPDEVAGFYWLVGRLEDRKQKIHDRAVADVARRYAKASGKLRRALGVLRIELQSGQGQPRATFREVTGALARAQVMRVRDDLSRIRDASDADQVHRTRISLKRLRYLLEPVARKNRRAGALVRRFKEAQDLLGEHHDMHVLSAAIASLRSGVSQTSFPGLDPGLAALAGWADDAAKAAYDRFQSVWGGELGNRILARAEELGRVLEAPTVIESGVPRQETRVENHESRVDNDPVGASDQDVSRRQIDGLSDESVATVIAHDRPLRPLVTRDS